MDQLANGEKSGLWELLGSDKGEYLNTRLVDGDNFPHQNIQDECFDEVVGQTSGQANNPSVFGFSGFICWKGIRH